MIRPISHGLKYLLGFSSFHGGAVLLLVTLDGITIVLVPLDSVVVPGGLVGMVVPVEGGVVPGWVVVTVILLEGGLCQDGWS